MCFEEDQLDECAVFRAIPIAGFLRELSSAESGDL
jgi:hypothetical protein